jgi:hypothetical protein
MRAGQLRQKVKITSQKQRRETILSAGEDSLDLARLVQAQAERLTTLTHDDTRTVAARPAMTGVTWPTCVCMRVGVATGPQDGGWLPHDHTSHGLSSPAMQAAQAARAARAVRAQSGCVGCAVLRRAVRPASAARVQPPPWLQPSAARAAHRPRPGRPGRPCP